MLNVNIKDSDWPEWSNWVAQDRDGCWFFYQNKPIACFFIEKWIYEGEFKFHSKGRPNYNWKQAIMKRPSVVEETEPRKHSHYYKDVRHLDFIDVYRVIDLFEVDNECLQHALKKILVSGKRGAKDQAKDVQEAIDTLVRWQEMQEEDKRKQQGN